MSVNFTATDKTIRLFEAIDAPLIILHTFGGEGERVYQAATTLTDKKFSLAAIGGLNWDDDMSPWASPPVGKNDTPCAGGADNYLRTFEESILPEILSRLSAKPIYIAAAGYSLAGLFSVYAAYRTDTFSRVASASGSFWFPNFIDFAQKTPLRRVPDKIYFSLGDGEAKVNNTILRTVEDNTRQLKDFYASLGIETTFELNAGNHFKQTTERMAKGIAWIL